MCVCVCVCVCVYGGGGGGDLNLKTFIQCCLLHTIALVVFTTAIKAYPKTEEDPNIIIVRLLNFAMLLAILLAVFLNEWVHGIRP